MLKNWCFWTVVLEILESPLDSKEIKPVNPKGNQPWIFIGSWSWNSNTLATWWEVLNHWKRPWCWERQRARGEGDDRGWDDWMAPWIWVSSGSWWWTGRPGMLWSMGLQSRILLNDWTELSWTSRKDSLELLPKAQVQFLVPWDQGETYYWSIGR